MSILGVKREVLKMTSTEKTAQLNKQKIWREMTLQMITAWQKQKGWWDRLSKAGLDKIQRDFNQLVNEADGKHGRSAKKGKGKQMITITEEDLID